MQTWSQRFFPAVRKVCEGKRMCSSSFHQSSRDEFFPDMSRRMGQISGLPIVHTESYVCALPAGHRFQMRKFRGVFQSLVRDRVIDPKMQVLEPPRASRQLASLAHSHSYVDAFFEGKTTKEEQRRTGFVWTHGLASRVRFEIGGTVLAALVALERGLCCSTGGGTHHAGPDYGSGFCLINDLAVTAMFFLDYFKNRKFKILVVDLDVHQGDGTALICQNEPAIFTFSMHCQTNFPFRKQKSDLDVGLRDGIGDKEYLEILDSHLPSLLLSFRPDLVLYDAGVDVHEEDQLGRINLTDHGIHERDQYVLESCIRFGVPVCTVIGGGYDKDLDKLSRRHSIIHRASNRVFKKYLSS